MPSTITHAYMANDIYNGLDINIKKKFSYHSEEIEITKEISERLEMMEQLQIL